jgi:hypothetical protein
MGKSGSAIEQKGVRSLSRGPFQYLKHSHIEESRMGIEFIVYLKSKRR